MLLSHCVAFLVKALERNWLLNLQALRRYKHSLALVSYLTSFRVRLARLDRLILVIYCLLLQLHHLAASFTYGWRVYTLRFPLIDRYIGGLLWDALKDTLTLLCAHSFIPTTFHVYIEL